MKQKILFFKVSKKRNIIKKINLILILFCSFVGVGFVSGAEIYEFFLRFGKAYYLGIILFVLLVYLIIYKMLVYSKIRKKDINIYKKSLKNCNNLKNSAIFGKKYLIKEFVFGLNSFIVSGAMFAGIRYFFSVIFENYFYYVYFASLVVVFLILLFGVRLLSKFDYVVFGFIICLFIFYIFNIKLDFSIKFEVFLSKNAFFALFFSVLYVFMNLFQMEPIIEISDIKFKNAVECKKFALVFTLILSFFLIVFAFMLESNLFAVAEPMPFLTIFNKTGGTIKIVFYFGLIFAIISTQVSGLLGLKNKLAKLNYMENKGNFFMTFLVFFVCLIFGFLPFKFFVSVFYPILGVINFITLVFC